MQISIDNFRLMDETMTGLRNARYPFWQLWRDLADYYLPKRYVWLQSGTERRTKDAKNPNILDGTGTQAARVLSAGMMNGITSPSRPWFSLRIPGFDIDGDETNVVQLWTDEVTRRIQMVMAETNYYNSLAIMYLDLVVFGSAATLIYEDDESVFRCYNPALGEFYFGQSARLSVDTFARDYTMTVGQVVRQFGEENCSPSTKTAWQRGGADLHQNVDIVHLIQPNDDGRSKIPSKFKYRETYWEKGSTSGLVLSQSGFNEIPGIFPRWELTANDAYGTSPALDALGDVIQLQHETKRKAQGLDKMISPPMIADVQLQHRPTALMPNGITFVAGNNNNGMKPAYQVQLPLQEISLDIQDVRQRIREIFHNPLFNMISQLDTVRSATEIDARREEKLVLLGSVLERFQNEALDPSINRIFQIMSRAGLLPEPPEEISDYPIEIQYVSILSTAQRAVSAIPTERWIGLIGNIAQIAPETVDIPDWSELVRNYGEDVGVPARNMKPPSVVKANAEARAQQAQQQAAMQQAGQMAEGAKLLSETDVGGGSNALQQVLGA